MSVLELMASKIDREEWRQMDIESAHDEHNTHAREIADTASDIESLIRDALNAGLSATGPEVGALRAVIDSYRVTATMVAARILEKKLAALQ